MLGSKDWTLRTQGQSRGERWPGVPGSGRAPCQFQCLRSPRVCSPRLGTANTSPGWTQRPWRGLEQACRREAIGGGPQGDGGWLLALGCGPSPRNKET